MTHVMGDPGTRYTCHVTRPRDTGAGAWLLLLTAGAGALHGDNHHLRKCNVKLSSTCVLGQISLSESWKPSIRSRHPRYLSEPISRHNFITETGRGGGIGPLGRRTFDCSKLGCYLCYNYPPTLSLLTGVCSLCSPWIGKQMTLAPLSQRRCTYTLTFNYQIY